MNFLRAEQLSRFFMQVSETICYAELIVGDLILDDDFWGVSLVASIEPCVHRSNNGQYALMVLYAFDSGGPNDPCSGVRIISRSFADKELVQRILTDQKQDMSIDTEAMKSLRSLPQS